VSGDERPDDRTELDDELRRLFADERLTLPVAHGADRAVVAGAHRRRRQRLAVAAAGGVIAVVAVVTLGLGLFGVVRGTDHSVTAAATPSVTLTTTTSTSTPVPENWAVLGPDGIGPLRLGMSLQQVQQVVRSEGLATTAMQPISSCESLQTIVYARLNADGGMGASATRGPLPSQSTVSAAPAKEVPFTIEVLVSEKAGVVRLGGSTLLHTPEGFGVGSRLTEVEQVYNKLQRDKTTSQKPPLALFDAPVPGNPTAVYEFEGNDYGSVTDMWLRSDLMVC
jgi:hypothetical protein